MRLPKKAPSDGGSKPPPYDGDAEYDLPGILRAIDDRPYDGGAGWDRCKTEVSTSSTASGPPCLAAAREQSGSDSPLPTKHTLCGVPVRFVFTVGQSPPYTLRGTHRAWVSFNTASPLRYLIGEGFARGGVRGAPQNGSPARGGMGCGKGSLTGGTKGGGSKPPPYNIAYESVLQRSKDFIPSVSCADTSPCNKGRLGGGAGRAVCDAGRKYF